MATAPPSVTKRVPGVVGEKPALRHDEAQNLGQARACLCAQSAGRRVEADEPVKAGGVYHCARPVQAGVAVRAAQSDRELLRPPRVAEESTEFVAESRASPILPPPVHPAPRDDIAPLKELARQFSRLGALRSRPFHPRGARRHAAATMMAAINAKESRLTRSFSANMIGSSSIRRRSAKINARPTQ